MTSPTGSTPHRYCVHGVSEYAECADCGGLTFVAASPTGSSTTPPNDCGTPGHTCSAASAVEALTEHVRTSPTGSSDPREALATNLRSNAAYWEDRLAQHPEDALEWADELLALAAQASSDAPDDDEPCAQCGVWKRFHGYGPIEGPEYSRDHGWQASSEAPDLRRRLDEANALGYREGHRAALASSEAGRLDEPTLTRILGEIAPVVGGDLLTGGVKHRIGLASAILARLAASR